LGYFVGANSEQKIVATFMARQELSRFSKQEVLRWHFPHEF